MCSHASLSNRNTTCEHSHFHCSVGPHEINMPLVFVCVGVGGHLSCFPVGAITSDADVSIPAHTFCANVQPSLWSIRVPLAGTELLGLRGGSTVGDDTKEHSKAAKQIAIFYLKLTSPLKHQRVSRGEIPLLYRDLK